MFKKLSILVVSALVLSGCASGSNDRASLQELADELSLGELQEDIAPNMVGLSMFDAQRVGEAISAWPDPQDWSPSTRDEDWEDWALKNFVCWQGPSVGEEVIDVAVAVSTDCSGFWIVPELVGLSAFEAKEVAQGKGFDITGFGYQSGGLKADDPRTICEQNVVPGTYLPREQDTWGDLRARVSLEIIAAQDCELFLEERAAEEEEAAKIEAERGCGG